MRLSLLLALSLFIGTVPVLGQAVTFEDVAQEVGVDHTFTGPSLGGGASFADFDGDLTLTLFDFLAFQSAFDAGC